MSTSDEKASDEVQGAQQSDSVFDFLYCDTQRIGSFLAQFDDAGHLQQVIEKETAHKSTRRGFKLSLGGGASLMGTGGSGNIGLERGPGAEGSEASERIYDPLWTNARTLMDYLGERDMIQRDISRARIGQFVLASGSLEIRDLKLIQKAMSVLKSLRTPQPDAAPTRDGRNRSKAWHEKQQAQQAEQQAARQGEIGLEFLGMLPHAVHAVVQMGGSSVWCSLRPESLIISSDDIFLKHGVGIPGEWHILGILDAQPDPATSSKTPTEQYAAAESAMQQVGDNAIPIFITKGFGGFIDGIAPFARILLGRQAQSYGMTPLLIFREVSG